MTLTTDPPHPELSIPSELAVRHAGATMTQPVLVLAPDAAIRYANDPGAAMLGLPVESIAGKNVRDTVANALAIEIEQRVADLLTTGHDTIFEVHFAERTWLCHIVPLRDVAGRACALSAFCHDVSHIHAHAQQQLAAQKELTDALVREVRHRVKNHLQGIVGLLRQHQIAHPNTTTTLNAAITQLLTIGAVYGLEARASEDRVYLCSVVAEVVRALSTTYQASHVRAPLPDQRATLDEQHAVPIALVINELITNAIKHTPMQQGSFIDIQLEFTPLFARLRIVNTPASLSSEIERGHSPSLGAGLNLVRALLPIGHASLSLTKEGAGVKAELTLLPPVVSLSDGTHMNDDDAPT